MLLRGSHPLLSSFRLCSIMVHPGDRPDPLKVFLGNLAVDVNKPKIWEMLEALQAGWPEDIIVPQVGRGKLAIAFLVFNTPEEASYAMTCLQGAVGPCCPNGCQAFRGGGGTAWESVSSVLLDL